MKRKIALVLVLSLSAFMLGGCGLIGSKDKAAAEDDAPISLQAVYKSNGDYVDAIVFFIYTKIAYNTI